MWSSNKRYMMILSLSDTKHVGKEKRGRGRNSYRNWKEKWETWDKKDKGRIKKKDEGRNVLVEI